MKVKLGSSEKPKDAGIKDNILVVQKPFNFDENRCGTETGKKLGIQAPILYMDHSHSDIKTI